MRIIPVLKMVNCNRSPTSSRRPEVIDSTSDAPTLVNPQFSTNDPAHELCMRLPHMKRMNFFCIINAPGEDFTK